MEKILDYKNIGKIGLVARLNTPLLNDIVHLAEILAKFKVKLLLENDCVKSLKKAIKEAKIQGNLGKNAKIHAINSSLNSKQIYGENLSKNSGSNFNTNTNLSLNLNENSNSSLNLSQIYGKNLSEIQQNAEFFSENLSKNTKFDSKNSSLNLNENANSSLNLKQIQQTPEFSTQISAKTLKKLDLKGFSLDELFKKCDFIISLGGDGTLISLCRKACEWDKALLGINAGHLGFLTDFTMSGAAAFFEEFFAGKFRIEQPFLLDILLENKKGKVLHKLAFNDVVFSRLNSSAMTEISVLRKGQVFNEYYGDGLIVATAAGSTAYNLSANGPIIYTLAEVFLLTPVCSHSLTQRPIVLPKGFELEIRAKECAFCIDGQEFFKTSDFKSIKLRLSDKKVSLIHPKNRDYFQILKEKLHWGK